MIGRLNISVKAFAQDCHVSTLADHVISTGHNIKRDHFDILATRKSYSVKLKKLFWSVISDHLMKMLVARSYFFINFYW